MKNREAFEQNYAMTLKEIAAELGVSRQTVRTIEKQAMDKIRKQFKDRGMIGQ